MKSYVFYSRTISFKSIEESGKKRYFVSGYITTGDLDLVNDIVTRSAMDDMLSQLKKRNIKLDFEHEAFVGEDEIDIERNKTKIPLGKILNAKLDSKGIFIEAELNPNWKKINSNNEIVMTFNEVWENVTNKFLDAFSIAYVPIATREEKQNNQNIRKLDRVNLMNVAMTGNPVNTSATLKTDSK